MESTSSQILSLKITLNTTNPAIWRKVLVAASVTFFDLHHIIQVSMGWTNSHLFEFQVGDYRIGYIDPNEAFEDIAKLARMLCVGQRVAHPCGYGKTSNINRIVDWSGRSELNLLITTWLLAKFFSKCTIYNWQICQL